MSATQLRSPEHASESGELAVPRSLGIEEALRQENEQLRTALATRIVIEQAKGMLAERFGIHVDEAFERLRRDARRRRMKLHLLATAVTAREAWAEAIFARRAKERTAARSAAREASTLAPDPQSLRRRVDAPRMTQSTDQPGRRPRTRHATEGGQ